MVNALQSAAGWTMVVLFTLTNIFMAPAWLFIALFGAAIGALEWRESLRYWLWLSTAQYVFPWWDWANR